MKILLFGSTGQVGSSMNEYLSSFCEILTDHDQSKRLNIQSKAEVENFLKLNQADLYINAIAYTDVDGAENNQQECQDINVNFVEQLVLFLKKNNKPLIHFSTDYVYGESNDSLIKEDSHCAPVNYYGLTKKIAEDIISQNLDHYFIFRISWVYSNRRKNFYKTMKQLFLNKNEINIIDDQWGAPTPAYFIAEIISHLISTNKLKKNLTGIYNLAPSNFTNWYEFAQKILKNYQQKNSTDIILKPTRTENYQTTAIRQKNSKLDCEKLKKTFNLQIPDWEYLLNEHEKRNINE